MDKFNGIDDMELAAELTRRLKHHGRIRTEQRLLIGRLCSHTLRLTRLNNMNVFLRSLR